MVALYTGIDFLVDTCVACLHSGRSRTSRAKLVKVWVCWAQVALCVDEKVIKILSRYILLKNFHQPLGLEHSEGKKSVVVHLLLSKWMLREKLHFCLCHF